MTPEVESLIHRTSVVSASLGVVFSPIPLLDELALLPVYGFLGTRIARLHAITWKQMPWSPILKSTAIGLVARAGINITFAVLPGVSALGSAATAVALTEILGEYLDEVCKQPEGARMLGVREVMGMIKARAAALRKKKAAATATATAAF